MKKTDWHAFVAATSTGGTVVLTVDFVAVPSGARVLAKLRQFQARGPDRDFEPEVKYMLSIMRSIETRPPSPAQEMVFSGFSSAAELNKRLAEYQARLDEKEEFYGKWKIYRGWMGPPLPEDVPHTIHIFSIWC